LRRWIEAHPWKACIAILIGWVGFGMAMALIDATFGAGTAEAVTGDIAFAMGYVIGVSLGIFIVIVLCGSVIALPLYIGQQLWRRIREGWLVQIAPPPAT
jgi:hypothetical protein